MQQTLTHRWTAIAQGSQQEITLGTTPELVWKPSDHLRANCGGTIEVRSYAMDPEGTSMDQRTVWLNDPPC